MLWTLLVGGALIVLSMMLSTRRTRLSASWAGLLTGLLALSAYLPFSLIHWPGVDGVTLHVALYAVTVFVTAMLLGRRRRAAEHRPGDALGPAAIWTFFSVILVINAAFITVSVQGLPAPVQAWLLPQAHYDVPVQTAFPGVVAYNYYQKRNQFNRQMGALELQRQRAWQVQVGWVGAAPRAGAPFTLQVQSQKSDATPLGGARVQVRWLRPSDSGLDLDAALDEVKPGIYESAVQLPAPGHWQMVVEVAKGGERHEVRVSTRLGGSG